MRSSGSDVAAATMTFLEEYLPYLIPPLLGALIGYVTNYIAIRMLFRPLRAWRVFGVRLPLTPGIIPATRGQLALRLGETVGRQLVTPGGVRDALERESFRRDLRQALDEKVTALLDRELGTIESLVPAEYRQRFQKLVTLFTEKLANVVFTYLHSEQFESRLRSYIDSRQDEFLRQTVDALISPSVSGEICRHLGQRLQQWLRSETLADTVGDFVQIKWRQAAESDRPLREALPAEAVAVVLAVMDRELPVLLAKLSDLLHEPAFRERLIQRSGEWIQKFVNSLAGVSGFFARMIKVDAIQKWIPGFFDEAGAEFADWLKEEATQAQLAKYLHEQLERLLDLPGRTLLEKIPAEKLDEVGRVLGQEAVALLRSPQAAEAVGNAVPKIWEHLTHQTFGELAGQLFSERRLDELLQSITEALNETARLPATREALHRLLEAKITELVYLRSHRRLADAIAPDAQGEISEFAFRQILELLRREVPAFVKSLDVKRMVEDKVNSLDVQEVEEILLEIMRRHLTYINIFGGLIGFLIGSLNLFF